MVTETTKRAWLTKSIIALCALTLVSACAGPTPYRAADGGKGYVDRKIEQNRYRVSFSGNSITKRETVEQYLLYRAAELTVQHDRDYFIIVDRETEKDTLYRTYYSSFPSYRAFGYYSSFYPYRRFGSGGFADSTTRARNLYTAHASILIFKGDKPPENPDAYDARDVIQNIGPSIVRETTS